MQAVGLDAVPGSRDRKHRPPGGEGGGPEPQAEERAGAGTAAARQANTRQTNTQNTGSEAKAEQANRRTDRQTDGRSVRWTD